MKDVTEGYVIIPKRKPLNRFRVIRSYSNRDRLLLALWQMYIGKQERVKQIITISNEEI